MPSEKDPVGNVFAGPQSAAGPVFFESPVTDAIVDSNFVLAGNVWTVQRRLRALEALLVERGVLNTGELDNYVFNDEDERALQAERQQFVERLYDPYLKTEA